MSLQRLSPRNPTAQCEPITYAAGIGVPSKIILRAVLEFLRLQRFSFLPLCVYLVFALAVQRCNLQPVRDLQTEKVLTRQSSLKSASLYRSRTVRVKNVPVWLYNVRYYLTAVAAALEPLLLAGHSDHVYGLQSLGGFPSSTG